MESDLRSSFLFGRIFVDEPASTSSENALDYWFDANSPRELVSISVEIALISRREGLNPSRLLRARSFMVRTL